MADRKKTQRPGESRGQNGRDYYGGRGYYDDSRDGRDYYGDGGQGGRGYYGGYYEDGGRGGRDYYGDGQDVGYYEDGGRDGRDYYGDGRDGGYYEGSGRGGRGYYDDGRDDGGYYDGPQETGGRKKKKKKHRKLIFVIEVLVLLLLAGGLFAASRLTRINRVKLDEILVNSGLEKQSGYLNIALFGVDSREGQLESGTNSDTIMVASLNEKTGEIRLVSVYRDTYLDNTNGEYRKATECFAGGGAERSVNMLNNNLDLDIEDFVTVDFNAIIEAVDLLGGIDLEITEEERKWLNAYLVETSQVTGVSYTEVESAGLQHLTGIQAMAYCRIRYTEGWDYKRTERQRTVLGKIFEKAQQKGVTGLIPMVTAMTDYISTSLSNTELLALASGVSKYYISETTGFPFNQQAAEIAAGDCVVPVNLAANVAQLHAYLFGDESYTPSQAVQEISDRIISETGIQ